MQSSIAEFAAVKQTVPTPQKEGIRTMNSTSRLVSLLALVALVVFGTGIVAHGVTVIWDSPAVSGNWDDGTKWTGGSAPQTTDAATITGQAGVEVDLNGNRSITGLSLTGPTTGMFTLGDTGDTLTLLSNSKVTVKDRVTVDANITFDAPTSGAYISATSSGNTPDRNTYVFNGDIDFGTYSGSAVSLFALSNQAHPSHVTFNGVLNGSLHAESNGLFSMQAGNNGSVTLNGDNTFTRTGWSYFGMNVIGANSVYTFNLGHSNALGNTGTFRINSSDTGASTGLGKGIVNLTQDGMVVQNPFWLRNASAGQISGTVAGHTTWAGSVTLGQNTHTDGVSVLPMTFSAVAGNTTTISGEISGSATTGRAVPVIIAGAGMVEFSNATGNIYTGGTTVAGGTLLVNNTSGSGTGTGAVVVEDGGTLGGSGIITGDTTVDAGGRLAPGLSPGILTTGNLTLQSGSVTTMEVWGATTPGVDFDQLVGIDSAATLTLEDGWILELSVISIEPITADLLLFDYENYSGVFAPTIRFARGRADAWSFNPETGILSLTNAVPEPTSLALFGLAAALGLRRGRRRP